MAAAVEGQCALVVERTLTPSEVPALKAHDELTVQALRFFASLAVQPDNQASLAADASLLAAIVDSAARTGEESSMALMLLANLAMAPANAKTLLRCNGLVDTALTAIRNGDEEAALCVVFLLLSGFLCAKSRSCVELTRSSGGEICQTRCDLVVAAAYN